MLNLLGVDVVAGASNLFALLVIAPFAALFLAGLPEVEPASWLDSLPAPAIRWGTFLSVMLWNTSGYDAVGALAAEAHPHPHPHPDPRPHPHPHPHPHPTPFTLSPNLDRNPDPNSDPKPNPNPNPNPSPSPNPNPSPSPNPNPSPSPSPNPSQALLEALAGGAQLIYAAPCCHQQMQVR